MLNETDIREYLYDSSGLTPIFNPTNKPKKITSPVIVDLSFDMTNHTRFYHSKTDAVRLLIANADAVVCENETLVGVARKFTNTIVAPFPFGFCPKADMQNDDGLIIGLLNHQPDMQQNNEWFQTTLKKLDYKLLVYGNEFKGLEAETTDDFFTFAARCDVLLLPSSPVMINSITMPLSVMMAGTAVIASNAKGYYSLNNASGVIMRNGKDADEWRSAIRYLENDVQRLQQLKAFNQQYATQVSRESVTRMAKLKRRLPQPEIIEEVVAEIAADVPAEKVAA